MRRRNRQLVGGAGEVREDHGGNKWKDVFHVLPFTPLREIQVSKRTGDGRKVFHHAIQNVHFSPSSSRASRRKIKSMRSSWARKPSRSGNVSSSRAFRRLSASSKAVRPSAGDRVGAS